VIFNIFHTKQLKNGLFSWCDLEKAAFSKGFSEKISKTLLTYDFFMVNF